MRAVLGIDIGSSFLKSAMLDLEGGNIHHEKSCPTTDFVDTQGPRREIPIGKLSVLVKELIDNALSAHSVEGIIFSVQMHGFALFDNAEPVTDFISWQDMRAYAREGNSDISLALRNTAGDELFKQNGMELKNNHSVCPLYHLVNEKKLRKSVDFTMMGDAVIRCLTGERAVIHPTVAASSGLVDLETGGWNSDVIKRLSLEHIRFPVIDDGREPAALYRFGGREIPIYTAVGDHQAAVLGSGAAEGDIVVNIGTGGQISYVDEGLSYGLYETRPYFAGRSLRARIQQPSGRALNVMMNLLVNAGKDVFGLDVAAGAKLWDRVNDLAYQANSAGAGPDVDMSFFGVQGGSVSGIDQRNFTVGGLFSGAYNFMAEAYYRAYLEMGLDREPCCSILGAGGVLRKTKLLQELIARRFGMTMRLSPNSEDVMSGLLTLARWHCGVSAAILPSLALREAI